MQAYREDNDWLGHFLEECCVRGDPSCKKNQVSFIRNIARIVYVRVRFLLVIMPTLLLFLMDKAGYTHVIRKNPVCAGAVIAALRTDRIFQNK